MKAAKKLVKEYERQLKSEPENLVLRLKLAAALREIGKTDDAVHQYGRVAQAYKQQGRLAQAIAVCKSVLEIEPTHRETQELLTVLDIMQKQREAENPSPQQQAASYPPAPYPPAPSFAP